MAADMALLIKNTNLESMEMIKKGIFIAIDELQSYEDPTGISYLKKEDVMNAIEKGYRNQVTVYDELRKGTLASGENLEQVHEITEDIWAKARATPLPSNESLNNGFNYNNNNNANTNTNNKIGGTYASKKLKKSRKPKH
jgi:hypothetical protein